MLGDGQGPPSKAHPNLCTRNYRGNSPNIVIAIVSIPLIDIERILRVISTDIGGVDLRLGNTLP